MTSVLLKSVFMLCDKVYMILLTRSKTIAIEQPIEYSRLTRSGHLWVITGVISQICQARIVWFVGDLFLGAKSGLIAGMR